MHSLRYLTLFAAAASAVLVDVVDMDSPQNLEAFEARTPACPPTMIVAAPGEGTTEGDLGYLQSTIDAIQGVVPLAGLHQIAYPAGYTSAQAISYGIPAFNTFVTSYAAQCPNSKMVTVGYSAGAAIVMGVLCGDANTGAGSLATDYRHNIVANIIYGDPTYIPGLKYDAGTCTTNTGEVPRQQPGLCYPFGRKTKSYCDTGDMVCCGGDDEAIHFTYPSLYDSDAAAWVKAKMTYYRRHKGNS